MDIPEIDPNFEPQIRARSNTWPVRPRDLAEEEAARTPSSNEEDRDTLLVIKPEQPFAAHEYGGLANQLPGGSSGNVNTVNAKKAGGSRRNAWGNLSYADLITKAIQTAPDCRLTLSQIYDWMVQNVPYFRDKGDSNSSAGWKNSIRHNLSLHSRFMRVQNEGTGKSSWWVLNPDAKGGKTPRRRATSMDTKAYEKKRGRVKKKVEALRAAMAGDNLSETGSYSGSAQELSFNDQFSLSPQDFRQRTSSNASSMGRLSPISQSIMEPDMHDSQVPTSVSPVDWNLTNSPRYDNYTPLQDQSLSECLAEMLVVDSDIQDPMVTTSMNSPLHPNQQQHRNQQQQLSPNFQQRLNQQTRSPGNGYMAPPPYNDQQIRRSPQPMQQRSQTLTELLSSEGSPNFPEGFLSQVDEMMASPPQGSMLGHYSGGCFPTPPNSQTVRAQTALQQQQQQQQHALLQQRANNSLLRQALTSAHCPPINVKHQQQHQQQHQQHQQHQQQHNNQNNFSQHQDSSNLQLLTGGSMQTSQQQQQYPRQHQGLQQQQAGSGSSLSNDFDMTDFSTDFGACDVDQILKHELAFDDNLDFNFDGSNSNSTSQNSQLGQSERQQLSSSRETTNTNAAAAAAAAAIAAGKFNNIVHI